MYNLIIVINEYTMCSSYTIIHLSITPTMTVREDILAKLTAKLIIGESGQGDINNLESELMERTAKIKRWLRTVTKKDSLSLL